MIHSDVTQTRFPSFHACLLGQTHLDVERCYCVSLDVTSKGNAALRRAEAFGCEHQPVLGMQRTNALGKKPLTWGIWRNYSW